MSKSNGQRPSGGGGGMNQQFLEDIIEDDVDGTLATPVRNLLSKDYPLSNIRRSDREYFRLLGENVAHYVQEQFPPKESVFQGELGAALMEDPDYRTQALSQQQRNEIETLLMASFARTSRGKDGWQQDKMTESIQTRRVEDDRQSEQDGLIGGLFD
jgi:hypothetical protein